MLYLILGIEIHILIKFHTFVLLFFLYQDKVVHSIRYSSLMQNWLFDKRFNNHCYWSLLMYSDWLNMHNYNRFSPPQFHLPYHGSARRGHSFNCRTLQVSCLICENIPMFYFNPSLSNHFINTLYKEFIKIISIL